MEITGRLTENATIKQLTDGRRVVSFDLAVNDFYRTRTGEVKEVSSYFDCSYWLTTNVAQHLTKGSIIEVYGRIGVYAYKNSQGEPKAALQFHVNNIRFIAQAARQAAISQTGTYNQQQGAAPTASNTTTFTPGTDPKDDLPF